PRPHESEGLSAGRTPQPESPPGDPDRTGGPAATVPGSRVPDRLRLRAANQIRPATQRRRPSDLRGAPDQKRRPTALEPDDGTGLAVPPRDQRGGHHS